MKKDFSKMTDAELSALINDKKLARAVFDEIYRRYSAGIFTYCLKILDNRKEAEDVFQETFMKFFEEVAKSSHKITHINGFLIKIAKNLCINEKTRSKYRAGVSLDGLELPDTNEQSYESKEMSRILESAISALPDSYREALVMKEYLGMSYQEISDVTGMSMGQVRVTIYRAKQKLREFMLPLFKDYTEKTNKGARHGAE
ncbi:MAG: RNA polymerase sigma factor [Chloroflexota bacterium]